MAPRSYSSLHPLGRGRDYGNANSDVAAIAAAFTPLATGQNPSVVELFWSPGNVFYDDGAPFTPSASLRAQHQDHVHVGLAAGADLSGATAGGTVPAAAEAGSSGGSKVVGLLGALSSSETAGRIVKVVAGCGAVIIGIGIVVTD